MAENDYNSDFISALMEHKRWIDSLTYMVDLTPRGDEHRDAYEAISRIINSSFNDVMSSIRSN